MAEGVPTRTQILEASGDMLKWQVYVVHTFPANGLGPVMENIGPHLAHQAKMEAEGIFIAVGPGIAADSQRLDLSVYDIAPTVLAGLGLPVADEMAHPARLDLFEDDVTPIRIQTYGGIQEALGTQGQGSEERIDASTEEQLRALGYIE